MGRNYQKKLTVESPYKDKADIAVVSQRILKLGVDGLFTDKEEIKLAKELEKKYLAEYAIETISDKNLLYYLIYLEVLHTAKLQKTANEYTTSNTPLPLDLLDAIHKNISHIIEIKDKLGLTKKEDVGNDAYKTLELLKKKFKIWAESNQASRTLICPHCSQMIMLKIRTESWEAQKHPYFKDRLLGNESLIRLYKQNKLSKADVASVLQTSPDYTDWLINKWKVDDDVNIAPPVVPLTADQPVSQQVDVSPSNDRPGVDTVTE